MSVAAVLELLSRPVFLAALWAALMAQGSGVVGLAALAGRGLPGGSAAARSSVWGWAFAALLALPVAPLLLTRWHVPLFAADADPAAIAGLPVAVGPFLGAALVLTFAGGVVARLAALARDAARVRSITRAGDEWPDAPATRLAGELAARAGIRRRVRVVYTDDVAVPATWRLWRPVILLPASARRWSADRARPVLRHELAHIRRLDYAAHLAAELACAVHWANPSVRRAARWLRAEQEAACDDEVLHAGTRPAEYAGLLLGMARDARDAAPAAPAAPAARCALAMAGRGPLKARIRRVLDDPGARAPARRGAAVLLGGLLFAFAMAAASVAFWSCSPGPADAAAARPVDAVVVRG
jgi:beta-lactamase regulating signal transducer with metallopeptidase domain